MSIPRRSAQGFFGHHHTHAGIIRPQYTGRRTRTGTHASRLTSEILRTGARVPLGPHDLYLRDAARSFASSGVSSEAFRWPPHALVQTRAAREQKYPGASNRKETPRAAPLSKVRRRNDAYDHDRDPDGRCSVHLRPPS